MKFKEYLKTVKRWYKKYFVGKTIIHAHGFAPAELKQRFTHRGVKMICIAFTNRRVVANKIPMTYLEFKHVYMMRRMPCLFIKNLYACFGKKAKGTTYKINHKN